MNFFFQKKFIFGKTTGVVKLAPGSFFSVKQNILLMVFLCSISVFDLTSLNPNTCLKKTTGINHFEKIRNVK